MVDDEAVAPHCAEHKVCAAGVESDDDALVVLIHGIFIVFVGSYVSREEIMTCFCCKSNKKTNKSILKFKKLGSSTQS